MRDELYGLSEDAFQMGSIIRKYSRQEISAEEQALLDNWIAKSEENKKFFDELIHKESLRAELTSYHEIETRKEAAGDKMMEMTFPGEGRVKPMGWNWRRIATAAAIVLFVTAGLWIGLKKQQSPKQEVVVNTEVINDAKPTTKLAKLILDDGREIILDSVKSGVLAKQGNISVVKQSNGSIRYATEGENEGGKIKYNTVYVPKGGDVVYLTLEDGSKVWLNAESSIRYPVAFSNDERKVNVTGEAYFEVASSNLPGGGGKRSFMVSKGSMNIIVLGTKFNVNTYDNEANIKVTLLEGSVKVQQNFNSKVFERTIKPGQQAVLGEAKIQVEDNVDINQVMAWKEGKFVFKKTNIQQITRQMERWYDLDPTQFEGDAVRQFGFNGEISRYNNVSKVIELLEKTGTAKFKVEGKKIIVSQR
jgi:ferric-dicitrate binding protein FerR (iron transport regulator)